jgi:hypothetical protein
MNSMQPAAEKGGKVSSVAWAVFFIWVGIAMLANFPWGWFPLGVGILLRDGIFCNWPVDASKSTLAA